MSPTLTVDIAYDWVNVPNSNPGFPGDSESGGSNGQGPSIRSVSDSASSVQFWNTSPYVLGPEQVLGDANGDGQYDIFNDVPPGSDVVDDTVLSWVPRGPVGGWVAGTTYTITVTMAYTAVVAPSGITVNETQVLTTSWTP